MSHPSRLAAPRRLRRRSTAAVAAVLTLLMTIGVTSLAAVSPASAALPASGVGSPDPSNNFPAYYTDSNGLALEICQDGLPNCLAGPELIQDVHASGGDAEAFYYSADATTTHFALHDALEAAYAADGPDQEVTFQRTQLTARAGGLPVNTKYTVTDPYGTFNCTTDATGTIRQNACRIETTPVPGDFNQALKGRMDPFLMTDPTEPAPPAGFIGDNTTPRKVVGSPNGFNSFRVVGPGLTGTCTNADGSKVDKCEQTDQFILQGKTVDLKVPTAALSAGAIDFGDVPGTPAVTKKVTYSNTGSLPLTISSIDLAGADAAAFAQTNTCGTLPATVDGGAKCTIEVTFTPVPGKSSAATLTVTDDTAKGTRAIALKGSNLGVMYVSDPTPGTGLAFPATGVGGTSLEDNVVIGNSGNGPLTIASATLTGASAGQYKMGPNNTCKAPVDPDGGCEIGVQFTPSSSGSKTANLRVTDSNGKIVNIPVTGSAVADTAAPSASTLSGTRTGTAADLGWTAATDNIGVTGYQVFRDGTQVGTNLAPTARSFNDAALAPGTYVYTVKAVDAAGNASAASNAVTITVPTPDTTPPSAPTLSGTVAGTTTSLSWPAATDNVAVTGYQVFRDGTQVGADLPATARTFSQTGVAPGTYSYTVKAMDAAGNEAPASNAVSLTVAAPDTTAPSAPTLSGSVTGTTANLSWPAATDNVGVTGYQVFRNGTQVGANLAATARTFSQTGLAAGTYSYTVKAMDAAGNAAPASNAVSLTVAAAATVAAPTITARAPAVNGTAVAVANNITATFSKAVTGVGTGTFVVKNPAGTVVAATVTKSTSTTTPNQWILNPTANLAADTKYTVTLTGGATAIRDSSANVPLATTTWTFLTGAAPTVSARTPASAATAVSRTANITATFSEGVNGVSGTTFKLTNPAGTVITAVVSRNGTTNQWILNPSATLAASTKYTVTLTGSATAIRDIAGNPLSTTTWSFTTGP